MDSKTNKNMKQPHPKQNKPNNKQQTHNKYKSSEQEQWDMIYNFPEKWDALENIDFL